MNEHALKEIERIRELIKKELDKAVYGVYRDPKVAHDIILAKMCAKHEENLEQWLKDGVISSWKKTSDTEYLVNYVMPVEYIHFHLDLDLSN